MKKLKGLYYQARESLLKHKLKRKTARDDAIHQDIEREIRSFRGLSDSGFFYYDKKLMAGAPSKYFHALERVHRSWIKRKSTSSIRSCLYEGAVLEVDINNLAECNVYTKGRHDPGVLYWLSTLVQPNTTAIDIGANVGLMTIPMAKNTGPGGKVIAYEPHPESYNRLVKNCNAASISHAVSLRNSGVADTDGVMTLHVPKNKGAATLMNHETDESLDVTVERPDLRAERVSMIKIDVEGFEGTVLTAIEEVISDQFPNIVVETTFDSGVIERLKTKGYIVREIINSPPFSVPIGKKRKEQVEILALNPEAPFFEKLV